MYKMLDTIDKTIEEVKLNTIIKRKIMQNQSFYSHFLVYSTHHLEMINSIKNNSFIIIKPPKKNLAS